MNIKEALAQLDTLDDDQWTADGAPKTDAVSTLVGEKVSRSDITEAAPKFSRSNNDLEESATGDDPEAEKPAEETAEPEELDTTLVIEFADMDPMLPEELVEKVLKKLDPRLLPEIENIIHAQIIEFEKREKEMEELKRKLKLSRATAQLWIKQLVPDMSNQEAIQAYIRSSHANRTKAAETIRSVLGGLKPADIAKLDPRAPIDRAFSRKTTRGGARPVRG